MSAGSDSKGDAADAPAVTHDLGFICRLRKGGQVEILHRGRLAATLRGRDAEDFMQEVGDTASAEAQQLMARVTGHYKHGNERAAAGHPRNASRADNTRQHQDE